MVNNRIIGNVCFCQITQQYMVWHRSSPSQGREVFMTEVIVTCLQEICSRSDSEVTNTAGISAGVLNLRFAKWRACNCLRG